MSPTSFVYGESVDASNFIQLDDLECHFQPLNVTLQVATLGDLLYHWVPREGPMGCAFYEKQPKGQARSKRNSSQPECVCVCVCVFSVTTHRNNPFAAWYWAV